MAFIFHNIWDVILPIDFHIFQRGRYTTNQINDPPCFGHITNLTQLMLGEQSRIGVLNIPVVPQKAVAEVSKIGNL